MGKVLLMRRKKKRPMATIRADPTPQRMLHSGGHFEEGQDGFGKSSITMSDRPFAVAIKRGAISERQARAGTKFYHHWWHSGMAGNLQTLDPNRVFGGRDESCGMPRFEMEAHHRDQYRSAVKEMGMVTTAVVERIVCFDVPFIEAGYGLGWENRAQASSAAMERLRSGLDDLCELWGI